MAAGNGQEPGATGPQPTRETRTFHQKRARDTHQRLLDASRDLFAERGFDATQTPDIAQRAGVSVGTFYRYFADKRQAFLEMSRAHLERAYEQIMGRLRPDVFSKTRSPAERRVAVDHVLDVLFQNAHERPELHRVFLVMSLRDAEVANLRVEFERRGRGALAALLDQVVPGRLPNAEASAEVIQVAAREIALGTAGTARTSSEIGALRNALADMIEVYVFGPGSGTT